MDNPYRWEHSRLVNEFSSACMRAGVSNSGFVISFSSGHDAMKARYLGSVLLARLEKANPPFVPGEVVTPLGKIREIAGYYFGNGGLSLPNRLTVEEVWYRTNNSWLLVFKERTEETCEIDAEVFEDGVQRTFRPRHFYSTDFKSLSTIMG